MSCVPSLVASFIGAKWLCDRHTATLEQETLADFIKSGAYERHLRRTRKTLAERKRELLNSIWSSLGNTVEISGESAGTHVVIWPRERVVEDEVVNHAASLGVGIYGMSQYFLGPPLRVGFLLGYSRLTPREIHEGVSRLREIPCSIPAQDALSQDTIRFQRPPEPNNPGHASRAVFVPGLLPILPFLVLSADEEPISC